MSFKSDASIGVVANGGGNIMRKMTLMASTGSLLMFAAGAIHAVPCEGVAARIYEAPVSVHKAQDGSELFHVQSTGTSMRKAEENSSDNHYWQHCTGLWLAKADKSGSGTGNCYSVDSDGEHWIISWEGGNAGGTWQVISGTGKYAKNLSAGGKWKPGKRYPNGMRTIIWEGECAD